MRRDAMTAALLVIATTGCFLSPGGCDFEHRSIEFAGTLTPVATEAEAVGATLMLNETRGDDPDFRTFHVEFTGTLAGTMESAVLRDVATGAVLAIFAGGAGWSSNVDVGPSPTQEQLGWLADEGRLQLRRVSAPATIPAFEGLLAVTSRTDWSHPRCD